MCSQCVNHIRDLTFKIIVVGVIYFKKRGNHEKENEDTHWGSNCIDCTYSYCRNIGSQRKQRSCRFS